MKKTTDKKITYLSKRIEITINHLQVASKQIYIIDGAILGFGYFITKNLSGNKMFYLFLFALALLLSIINFLHSRFVIIQSHWFRQNDIRIRELLEEPNATNPKPFLCIKGLSSAHTVHMLIHTSVLIFSLILSVVFLVMYFKSK
jgi:hypothetical protein